MELGAGEGYECYCALCGCVNEAAGPNCESGLNCHIKLYNFEAKMSNMKTNYENNEV